MTVRTFTVVNTYADEEVTTTGSVDIDGDRWVNDPEYRDTVENEDLFELTGTGRSGDAYYTVTSSDGLDPFIEAEYCG